MSEHATSFAPRASFSHRFTNLRFTDVESPLRARSGLGFHFVARPRDHPLSTPGSTSMSSSSPAGPAGGGAGDVCIGGIGSGIVDVGSGSGFVSSGSGSGSGSFASFSSSRSRSSRSRSSSASCSMSASDAAMAAAMAAAAAAAARRVPRSSRVSVGAAPPLSRARGFRPVDGATQRRDAKRRRCHRRVLVLRRRRAKRGRGRRPRKPRRRYPLPTQRRLQKTRRHGNLQRRRRGVEHASPRGSATRRPANLAHRSSVETPGGKRGVQRQEFGLGGVDGGGDGVVRLGRRAGRTRRDRTSGPVEAAPPSTTTEAADPLSEAADPPPTPPSRPSRPPRPRLSRPSRPSSARRIFARFATRGFLLGTRSG